MADKVILRLFGYEIKDKNKYNQTMEMVNVVVGSITGVVCFYLTLRKIFNDPFDIRVMLLPASFMMGLVIGRYWTYSFPILIMVEFYQRLK